MHILIVDDTLSDRIVLKSYLKKMGHEITDVGNGTSAINYVRDHYGALDLIIMDVLMPEMDGHEAARHIRLMENDEWIPIIFLSGQTDDRDLAAGIDAGGDDYLFKPVNKTILQAKIYAMQRISVLRKNLAESVRQLELISQQDGLTGAANRRHLDSRLEQDFKKAQRDKTPLSFCMIDVDHFKHFNDSFGHLAGDECLKMIVSVIRKVLRYPDDLVARYGGEEFCCLLPDTPKNAAVQLAETMRSHIQKTLITHKIAGKPASATVSIGVSTMIPKEYDTVKMLIRQSDTALYEAKSTGRNQVKVYREES